MRTAFNIALTLAFVSTVALADGFFAAPADHPAARPPRCAVQLRWDPAAPEAVQIRKTGANAFPDELPCNRTELLAMANAVARAVRDLPAP